MVAAKLANLELGDNQHSASANLQTQTRAQAAEKLNVSERTVNAAKKVQQQATPELHEKVIARFCKKLPTSVRNFVHQNQEWLTDADQVAG